MRQDNSAVESDLDVSNDVQHCEKRNDASMEEEVSDAKAVVQSRDRRWNRFSGDTADL